MQFRNGSYYIYTPLGIVVRVCNAQDLNEGWVTFAKIKGVEQSVPFEVPATDIRAMTSSELDSFRAHRDALKG
jgi:hypothetical protein